MKQYSLTEVMPGVLKIDGNETGPDEVEFDGSTYFRFMDYFYIKNKNLDELDPEQVSNLCRAREMYPLLIGRVNVEVRKLFKLLSEMISPSNLLEIGAGKNPLFGVNDTKPDRYLLADADAQVVEYHLHLGNECYQFSEKVCEIPQLDQYFDMVIAIFVLHFPFHKKQLLELSKRLRTSGIIVANIYSRSPDSRDALSQDISETGFVIAKIEDSTNLCRNHEYWVIGNEAESVNKCAIMIREIMKV